VPIPTSYNFIFEKCLFSFFQHKDHKYIRACHAISTKKLKQKSLQMENSAMEHLRQLVRRLEDNPDMRKGVLTETLLRDASIEWDAIFYCLNLRGRHRAKMRWRRAVIQEAIRRPFLRGGARRSTLQMTPNPPIPSHPLKIAPWFIDVRELDSFHPQEVWDRFRMVFPVLAVYRSGWVTANTTADSPPHLDPSAWKTIWKEWRSTVDIIGHTLN
jgi:hypothetical protein